MTSLKDQQQYWENRRQTYRYVPVKEFVDAFQSFHIGAALNSEFTKLFRLSYFIVGFFFSKLLVVLLDMFSNFKLVICFNVNVVLSDKYT